MQIAYLIIFDLHKISINHEIYISKYINHLQKLRIFAYIHILIKLQNTIVSVFKCKLCFKNNKTQT
jgi:hypothetical protein